jgi:hypothetical protein
MDLYTLPNLIHKANHTWLSHGLSQLLLIGAASRLLVFVSAIAGNVFLGARAAAPGEYLWNSEIPFVNLFSRWDSGWYVQIALNGYPAGGNPVSPNWAWFPLYPFFMKVLGPLFSGWMSSFDAVLVAGFLISNVLFFVSLFLFYEISKLVLKNRRLSLVSTIFFSFWPGSLFYSCVYSESMFMTLALGAFYFLEKGAGGKSTVLGFLAGLTRSSGFLVFIPFLFKGLRERKLRLITQSFIVATPYLWFSLFGYFSTGLFPVREIVASQYWGTPDFLPIQFFKLTSYLYPWSAGYAILLLTGFLMILLPFMALLFLKPWKILPFSSRIAADREDMKYWAFSLVTLAVILFYSSIFSMQRYAITILPIYWIAATLWERNRKWGILMLDIMVTLLVISTILFANWLPYY